MVDFSGIMPQDFWRVPFFHTGNNQVSFAALFVNALLSLT
jgi:hypothetical protein